MLQRKRKKQFRKYLQFLKISIHNAMLYATPFDAIVRARRGCKVA